jgi:hypothetical protein
VALLLGLARMGALLVAVGAVLVLAFGIWLVDQWSRSSLEEQSNSRAIF